MRRIVSFFAVLFIAVNAYAAIAPAEQTKINALLDSFAADHVTFIRNGEEHKASYAKKHLQAKLAKTTDVTTAQDFITKVASTSAHTGKPYIVKLKDGTQVECGKWLQQKLDAMQPAAQ